MKDLCGLFGMSKQAYYKHDFEADLRCAAYEEFALQFVRETREQDPGIGSVKLWEMYRREFGKDAHIGRDRFCELIARNGLKLRQRPRRPRTTDSRHNRPLYPNIIKNTIPTGMGEIIVGDITYLPLEPDGERDGERKFCYVSLVMDSYSKLVLGASVGPTLESRYPIEALEQAIQALEQRGIDLTHTIHHTDRGVQYASAEYTQKLIQKSIKISMTESGNPKDNSEAERLNNTLKNELFKDMHFSSIDQVRAALAKALRFYNNDRPHLSLNKLTPIAASRHHGRFKRDWISYRERALDLQAAEKAAEKLPE